MTAVVPVTSISFHASEGELATYRPKSSTSRRYWSEQLKRGLVVAVGDMDVVAASESLVTFFVDVNISRTEQAVGNISIGLIFNPTDETAPLIGFITLKLTVEEAVVDVSVIRVATCAEFANQATAGAVAIDVELDFDARAAVADMAGAESLSHEAASILIHCHGDASRHMQVLDGGVLDKAERACWYSRNISGVGRIEVAKHLQNGSKTN